MEACHFPTGLLVKGDALTYLARKLAESTKVPGYLLAGPPSEPPSCRDAHIASDPSAAMLEWYKQARVEFSDLTGMQCAHKSPKFSWRRASDITNPATVDGVSTMLSRIWRNLERNARLVCRIAFGNRPSRYNEHIALAPTARSMFRAHLHLPSRTIRDVGPVMHSWATAFWRAVATAQANTAHSLRAMAGAKAKKIEGAALKLNMAKWKQVIGASSALMAKLPGLTASRTGGLKALRAGLLPLSRLNRGTTSEKWRTTLLNSLLSISFRGTPRVTSTFPCPTKLSWTKKLRTGPRCGRSPLSMWRLCSTTARHMPGRCSKMASEWLLAPSRPTLALEPTTLLPEPLHACPALPSKR